MNAKRRASKGTTVPPSPYDFEETVRRVLKAPPMPKPKQTRRKPTNRKP